METLKTVALRVLAYAGASLVGAATPLLITGNPEWWLAGLGAALPHVAMIVSALFRAYGQDGNLTQAEIDEAFDSVEPK